MESILQTIRKMLGIEDAYTGFDTEILVGINSSIMALGQIGVGPEGGLVVIDESQLWSELYAGVTNIESVKSYVYLKTRLLFDPPTTAHLITAINEQAEELAWRLTVQTEPEPAPEV